MTRDRSAVIAVNGASAATAPPTGSTAAEAVDETGEVRAFMFRAWGELLGCDSLTEHSDFFARGGDSLLLTRLVRRIGREFGVAVQLHDMSCRNLGDQVLLVEGMRSRAGAGVRDVRAFLAGEWARLLGCEGTELAERSDFFALGGDSLLMTRLVRRVGREYGVSVAVHDMLAAPTLSGQALLVSSHLTAAPRLTLTIPGRSAA
ncbi:acyl carrier protein [Streptomyces sp. NPDC097619]|uniref:acyl carrier protein n=1 Tax=Streptomyces sp. NPDC097619 TaxID=3157228 RepID=UPI00332C0406